MPPLPSRKFLVFTTTVILGSPFSLWAIIHSGDEELDHTSESALLDRVTAWSDGVAFPYWKNLGQIERSTGIYLGNGYVLTAAHVGPGTFRAIDGKSYPAEETPVTLFKNHDGSLADLCMYRIRVKATDPLALCPSVPLTTMPPRKGTPLVLVGGGAGAKKTGRRFVWNDDYRVRWGLSAIEQVYSVMMPTSRYTSYGFGTRFEKSSVRCQAAPGDSGGAAFHFNRASSQWELAGVIVAVDSRFGAAEFGNQTYLADPALFRRQLAVSKSEAATLLASRR